MLFVSLFKWWYSDGLRQRAKTMVMRLDGVVDYFSIDLLLKTLFQPFRQDVTGSVDGSLDVKLHAFADNMISRVLGALIRMTILIFGIISIILYSFLFILALVVWILVPLIPVISIVCMIFGVGK